MTPALTPQRSYLETVLLPRFAQRFTADAVVLNVGAGVHAYRDYFQCPVRTADRSAKAGCDAVFPAEAIPYPDASVDGVLFNGVFDRLDDPMQAMRELRRVLKPTGALLFGAAGLDFDWRVDRDRWRLSPGGFRHVLSAFRVLEEQRFDNVYQYAVVQ